MKGWKSWVSGFALACLALSCAGTPQQQLPVPDLYKLIDSRMSDGEFIATTIQLNLIKIRPVSETVVEFTFLLPGIQEKLGRSQIRSGNLYFRYMNHDYIIYFASTFPKTECWSVVDNRELRIQVLAVSNDPSRTIDAGRYEISMIDDQQLWWHWYLMPAYPDASLSGVGMLDSETSKRIKSQTAKHRC